MPPRKRQAAASSTPEASGRRRSTRVSSSAHKSSYFEDSDSDSEEVPKRKRSKPARPASGRRKIEESEDEYEEGKGEEEEDDDDDNDEEDEEEDNNGRGNVKDDNDDDEEFDEDAPPKVTFIPHKKLRGEDGVAYSDTTLHPNTMLFLRDLFANNRRPWLKENDAEFRRAQNDWTAFVETLTGRLIAEADDTVPELPAKDVIFRIYRDTRFSKEPTPYKPHFSAAWSRTGRKGPYACYYVHCQPGGHCFVGGGLWHPEASALQLLRASIDERPQRWRRTIARDPVFRRTFLPGTRAGDEAAALRAFAAKNTDGALKTKPKGFSADHRDIALLKLRNFTIGKSVADDVLTATDSQDQIVAIFKAMSGFVTHLNRIVMPDPGDDSGDDSGDE